MHSSPPKSRPFDEQALMPGAAASGRRFGDGWWGHGGAGGDGGEGCAPPATWDPEKPPGGKLCFFPVESRAPMLRHANPGCWGGVREVAGLQRDAGKLYSQWSCSNEKMNQTSYGVDLELKYEE